MRLTQAIPMPIRIRTLPAGFGLVGTAIGVVALHLCLSLRYPNTSWITPSGWIVMYVLVLIATARQVARSAPEARWRWCLVALNACLAIASFLCILYAELRVVANPMSEWLNELFRSYRGLALLLVVCMPEETEYRLNRLLDVLQAVLIGLIFFALFSPSLLSANGVAQGMPGDDVLNRYIYAQSTIVCLLATLAVFTARTEDSRLFHRVLAMYLWIGTPISIFTNHYLINLWQVPDASPLFTLSDLCLLAFVTVITLTRKAIPARQPSQPLIFLRLGAAVFLPLFALLASMLLAIAGHHPVLGILSGLLSLVLFGVRSANGQLQVLNGQWKLEAANAQLELLSQRDPLTGLYNRRWFAERLDREWRRLQRVSAPLSVLLLDVDFFKLYNDTQGHSAGDAALKTVSAALARTLRRGGDALVRYGGEEFIALLPETDAEGALVVAESMMHCLAELHIAHPASPFGLITISIGGVTAYSASQASHQEEIVAAADRALYRAKDRGRNGMNLVTFHSETASTMKSESRPRTPGANPADSAL
jgi:diguanylate cyclase (GGDEF)-like protein